MAPICGIDAETIRYVARLYATLASASMILWGMGISQHVHGTDNARCLIALSLMTGQIGRPGTGLHPLRGQNNVQGASDAGLIPMMFPDYQHVSSPAARARFESAWGLPRARSTTQPGLTVVEVMHAIKAGDVRGMYIMGENPAMSDPDANHAREALAALEHLVVQDIFLTETAYLADVILPASAFPEKTGTFTNTDRLVQLGRQALDPPGDARQDLWIIQQIAKRMGLTWHVRPRLGGVRRDAPHHAEHRRHHLGAARARARRHLSVHEGRRPGRAGRVRRRLPARRRPGALRAGRHHPRRRAARRRVPDGADHRPPARALAHRQHDAARDACSTRSSPIRSRWSIRSTWRRSAASPGDVVTIESRRGEVALYARADDSSPRGAVFVPFCYYEAAINSLTNAALDPFAQDPGVQVLRGAPLARRHARGADELRRRPGAGAGADAAGGRHPSANR